MIERYENDAIKSFWSDTRKYEIWYRIEQAIAESNAMNMGESIWEWKPIAFMEEDIEEIKRIEKDLKHDVAAFLQYICEENPKNARFIHSSLTSSDLVDTFNSFAIKNSLFYVVNCVYSLTNKLNDLSFKNLNTKMLGRTHGQHASIITLGHKLEVYCRQLEAWSRHAKIIISNIGYKLAGPVGMGCNINESDAWMLDSALDMDRLHQCGSTQVIPRYYYYEAVSCVLSLSMILASIATDLRLLNQTEIGEFVVHNSVRQWGSSSMPHKINPITLERVCGMSRLIKGYFNAFIDNIVLWNERDISNSSVERIVLPDMFHVVVEQTEALEDIVNSGEFDHRRMADNLLNAKIGVLSNKLVQIMLEKHDISYIEAVKRVKDLLSKYDGMKVNDITKDTIRTSDEIEALKELGII